MTGTSKQPTITRTYPVRVIDVNGKEVEAGKPATLLVAATERHEARFGLSAKTRNSAAAEEPVVAEDPAAEKTGKAK